MGNRLFAGLLVLALMSAGSVGGVTSPGAQHAQPSDASERAGASADVASQAPASDAAVSSGAFRADAAVNRRQATCNYRQLYDRVSNGTVAINASNETGVLGGGSGWVYRIEGSTAYVVTNWHVAFNATEYDVQFAGGRWREAELVGADLSTDLAVLSVENAPESATALELARQSVERGQPVAVFGNPLGLEESISTGVVSGTERAVTVQYQHNLTSVIPNTIQVDAAVNPGNSGGALVNCEGRVVGVNYAGAGPLDAGINFAIDASVVREVVPALVETGTYRHSFLGIRPVSVGPTLAEVNNLSVVRGVMVADVVPDSPAAEVLRPAPAIDKRTGLPYDGDVILAADGRTIEDTEDLLTFLLLETRPGETVNLTVLRDGANRTVQVTLGERPSIPAQPRTTTPGTTTTQTTTTTETTTETPTTTVVQPASAADAARTNATGP
ncbi:S1C family serine protease [Halorussus aquaticus]|uniref:S1C family serine protease n=1 Tax=Halorussus aquaticus TaxID=2953748 RepID=A0ABD5Q305_9EURY|nr:trypsin-like peptidase domain-containing protein [Halorussus aquaticus]